MSRGIQWIPARADQVPRMQDHRTCTPSPSSVEEKFLDSCLLDSVVAEWMSGRVFGRRHDGRTPVHPDRAAMEQQRLARLQCVQQLLRARWSKADEIDDRIRPERSDPLAECPRCIFRRTVYLNA